MDAPLQFRIPRIATSRLLLREARRGDFEAFARDSADPAARKHLELVNRRMAWRMFNAGMGTWAVDGAGWWMVELVATREPVGMVGAFFREGPEAASERGDLELGWVVFRSHWRRGYATEAARAALDFGFDQLRVPCAIAHIDANNVASIRVSERLGMHFVAEVDFYGERTGRYRVDSPS